MTAKNFLLAFEGWNCLVSRLEGKFSVLNHSQLCMEIPGVMEV